MPWQRQDCCEGLVAALQLFPLSERLRRWLQAARAPRSADFQFPLFLFPGVDERHFATKVGLVSLVLIAEVLGFDEITDFWEATVSAV